MYSFQMSKICILFCVLLATSWICWFADGSCLYPGHRTNENIIFSLAGANDIYTNGTIATFYCENNSIKDKHRELECHVNGSWILKWDDEKKIQCNLTMFNRCQRRTSAAGISKPMKTTIIDDICIHLHSGIIDATKIKLEATCDTTAFQSKQAKQNGSHYYSINERKAICEKFEFPKRQSQEQEVLFLTKPSLKDPTDVNWLTDFSDALSHNSQKMRDLKCPYLHCYTSKNPEFYTITGCDISNRYWICRHEISSCGIPNVKKNSLMKFTGIYVGNVTKYRCYDGYRNTDNLTRECRSDGLWSGKAPRCKPVDCGTPSPNENVSFVLTNSSTTLGSWLNYTCKSLGHYLNGSEYRTCQADGKWHGEEPICIEIDKEPLPSSQFGLNPGEENLLILIVGVIAGITVFVIGFMWLVLAVVLWRDKRKHQSQS